MSFSLNWRTTALAISCTIVLTACENMPQQLGQVLNEGMPTTANTYPQGTKGALRDAATREAWAMGTAVLAGNTAPQSGAAPSLITKALPLGRYRNYNYNDMAFQFAFAKNGQVTYTDLSDRTTYRGTWKQDGARITVTLNMGKNRKDTTVYEYRTEARSSSVAGECRKQAPGLYPVMQDGKPVKPEYINDLILWSEQQVKSKNGPCLTPK